MKNYLLTSICDCLMKLAVNGSLLILLNGCVGPYKPDIPQKVPNSWTVSLPVNGHTYSLDEWWKAFNDPTLDILVNDALKNNLDIAKANLLLQKMSVLGRVSSTSYFPSLSAGIKPMQSASARENYLHAGISMSWELSLYGESANRQQTARAHILSTQAQEQAVRVSIVANVVQNYLHYLHAGQQLELIKRQQILEVRLQNLETIRKNTHIGSFEEPIVSRLRVAHLEALIVDLKNSQAQSLRMLGLLTMHQHDGLEKQLYHRNIKVPIIQIKEIPADLLRIRPDIRQAEADLLQSAAEVGLAKAALYPRFELSGSLIYAYKLTHHSGQSSTHAIPGLGPVIDIPLWDWGQRLANKKAKEHELQAALLAYRKTVLDSIRETEDALFSLASQDNYLKIQNAAFEDQKRLQVMQGTLTSLGLSSEYELLHVKKDVFQMQSKVFEARFNYALALINLYKALGGAPLSALSNSLNLNVVGPK